MLSWWLALSFSLYQTGCRVLVWFLDVYAAETLEKLAVKIDEVIVAVAHGS